MPEVVNFKELEYSFRSKVECWNCYGCFHTCCPVHTGEDPKIYDSWVMRSTQPGTLGAYIPGLFISWMKTNIERSGNALNP